jgi:hypothetical protein
MRRVCTVALAAAALAGWSPAGAHEGATTAFARIVVSGSAVRYSLTLADASRLALPTAGESLARAVRGKVRLTNDGAECAPTPAQLVPPAVSSLGVTVVVDFAPRHRARALEIRDHCPMRSVRICTPSRGSVAGRHGQFAFAAESRTARFEVGADAAGHARREGFFRLGIERILSGYDHLLFLLVLVLGGGGPWSMIKIITAFTVAHSVTLALAVLGIVTLPDRLVEAAIALSIAYVAAENLFARQALSRRWAVSLGFGLVHGFGFASVLRELGLPAGHVAVSLGAFNIGVEAGQAVVALPLVWLLVRVRGTPWEPKVAAAVSAIVLAVGLALFVERVALAG